MYHLVIAKDKECIFYKIIKSGTLEEICAYTTKFKNSKAIRIKNEKIVNEFQQKYLDTGDIVIINDLKPSIRIRVLYKKDINATKIMLYSHQFGKFLANSNKIKNLSWWNINNIRSAGDTEYRTNIIRWLNRRKTYGDFFETIYNIQKAYDSLVTKNPTMPNRTSIYKTIQEKTSKKDENKYTFNKPSEFSCEVNDSYKNGGMEEIFNTYSLDDLYNNLTEDEIKGFRLGQKD